MSKIIKALLVLSLFFPSMLFSGETKWHHYSCTSHFPKSCNHLMKLDISPDNKTAVLNVNSKCEGDDDKTWTAKLTAPYGEELMYDPDHGSMSLFFKDNDFAAWIACNGAPLDEYEVTCMFGATPSQNSLPINDMGKITRPEE